MFVLSLGEFLWSLLVIFFMVIYFMMLLQVIVDVFRRHDASGWKKAGWLIFLLVVPVVALIAYMVTNSAGMAGRESERYQRVNPQLVGYSNGGSVSDLERAKGLLDTGAISSAEYDQIKSRVLA
jgi:hypothetical protein